MSRVRVAAAVVSLALAGGLLTGPATAQTPPAAAPDQVDAPVPVLTWGPCPDFDADGPECATATAPLDYDDPDGATIELDLLRVPATDPAQRIGTLFVNPGGPGGSSRWFAAYFGELVPEVVSNRFDIVGVDPRGVGPSADATCRTKADQPRYPRVAFPTTGREARRQIRFDAWVRDACADDPSPVIGHMSTADTARDMDLVRQALGEDLLTYYGISYGTQLGATYAAMFPDRIRAMVLDGVLDPVEWTTGRGDAGSRPFSERLGSAYGAWQGLTAAFAECDRVGQRRCVLAGHAAQTWLDVVKRLRREPLRLGRGAELRYSDVVAMALGSLYSADQMPFLMRELRSLHRRLSTGRGTVDAEAVRRLARPVTSDEAGPYRAPVAAPAFAKLRGMAFPGVACADSDNPSKPKAWIAAGKRADRAAPWFGRLWTWASSICAGWPAVTQQDRFTGPFEVTPSAPVLVVGNTYDPATPLHGARALNRYLDGSRLLVLDGWGHGALATGPCIDEAYADYLVDGTLPRPGTVCRPARPLFPRR